MPLDERLNMLRRKGKEEHKLSTLTRQHVQSFVGQQVQVNLRDGSTVSGKLERFTKDTLFVRVKDEPGKARVRAFILPLALFSVLAIGLAATGCGPCGGPYGPGPYGPYGPGPYGPGPYGPGPYGPYGPGPGCCSPYGGKGKGFY